MEISGSKWFLSTLSMERSITKQFHLFFFYKMGIFFTEEQFVKTFSSARVIMKRK